MSLTSKVVRRAFGVSWWRWTLFRFSRENRSYAKAARRAVADREVFERHIVTARKQWLQLDREKERIQWSP